MDSIIFQKLCWTHFNRFCNKKNYKSHVTFAKIEYYGILEIKVFKIFMIFRISK